MGDDTVMSNSKAPSLRVNWIFPKPTLAGGVKSNRLLAEAMVRRGHAVTLVFPTQSETRPYALGFRIRRWKSQVTQLFSGGQSTSGRHHLESSTATILPIDRDCILESDVPDADVCIATWWRTREWIEPWSDAKGAKAYFVRHHELHGGDPERVRSTYRMAGMKFVIARWLKRLMEEEYGDSSAVLVPNGVDRQQFQYITRVRSKPPTIGMLYGRQTWKGAGVAFDAMRIVQRNDPSVRVVCFGRESIARDHHPPGNFTFHLRPEQNQIPLIYKSAECWLVPSSTEGFGMPGIEAAACGCPLVATRCGGPEDFVEVGRNGYLVPVGDSSAMADAISRILTQSPESWLAMSEASHQISLRFDWDRSAAILESALLDHVGLRR